MTLFERSNKIPFGPINNMKGVFENEQVRCFSIAIREEKKFDWSFKVNFLGQVLEMKNPNRSETVRVVGKVWLKLVQLYFVFSGPSVNFENIDKSTMLRYPAPILGEHTRTILKDELNYTEEQIVELMQKKIVQWFSFEFE